MNKKDVISSRRFRMGHSMELMSYLHRINMSESATCRLCDEEDETTEHVTLRCPALDMKRMEVGISKMEDLASKFNESWDLWRKFREMINQINNVV